MEEKRQIRRQILSLRDRMTKEEIAAKSRAVVERLTALDAVRQAGTVMAFMAFGSEVDLEGFVRWAWEAGKRVTVPHCRPDERGLTACRIDGFAELAPGHYGIRAPRAAELRPVPPGEIDTIVVPGAAFDRRGYRIGYGGGYYDRFLLAASRAARIGAAFACQIVPTIPAEPHDIPVDAVVTEAETIIGTGQNDPDGQPIRPLICP
jgi:5-formyltetrahydrofolate cyclo-ligase